MEVVFWIVLAGGIAWMVSKYLKQKKSTKEHRTDMVQLAYRDGVSAKMSGWPIESNPYVPLTDRWTAYREGWNNGK
jgi:hypothetical protein